MGDCPVLNFDPHRWLAERGDRTVPNVATVATVATVRAETENSFPKESPATVATTATDCGWREHIARLDPRQPPEGLGLERWASLIADAMWLAESHGDAAAALGWSASDLFGRCDLPGWGGLADRLEGALHIALTDRVGHWRTDDLDGWLWRRTLRPMPTIWEVAAHG